MDNANNIRRLKTGVCICGGGPAGMVLGYLLARCGIEVAVLEKHADFLRDFRGDTIHPSTLRAMDQLGLLDEFLKLPHQKAYVLQAQIGDETIPAADFSHLDSRWNFIAFMPQWDFLNFIAKQAGRYAHFSLLMRTEALDVMEDGARVTGVRARGPEGEVEIFADLVVASDGRHSTIRRVCTIPSIQLGAPMDVLWFAMPRRENDGAEVMGRFEAGRIFIQINRGDHWQCGYVIAKGSLDVLKQAGLDTFRLEVMKLAPQLEDRIEEIKSWDDVKLLSVSVERMERWHRPGLLFIGDAAHTMSPVGGVGINLAIQDAIAAANILCEPLRRHRVGDDDLARVQQRRDLPVRITQAFQVFVQNRFIKPALTRDGPVPVPFPLRLLKMFPVLRRLPARFIGLGIRSERIETGELPPA